MNTHSSTLSARHRIGKFWQMLLAAATIVGILSLIVLIYNVVNEAAGLGCYSIFG